MHLVFDFLEVRSFSNEPIPDDPAVLFVAL